MKHCIYLIVFLVLSFSAKAQKNVDEGKIFLLHPSVGLTITVDDKTKYNLFPQYIDSVFESAQLVKYNDSTFTFLFKTIYDDRIEVPTSLAEINEMYNKVESITPASNKVITHFNPIEPKEPKYEQIEDMENENERWTRYENNKKKETSCKYCDEIEDVAFEILTRAVFVSFELLGNCLVHACK